MEGSVHECRGKPTLLDLRERYGINILQLADKSDVPPVVVYCMLLSRPVSRSKALNVLRGLSTLIGVDFSFDSVDVPLSEESSGYRD
jgi:hypothetical protein